MAAPLAPRRECLELGPYATALLERDLPGATTVAYHEAPGKVVAGASLLAVAALAGRGRLDATAAVAALLGEPLADRTLAEGIRQLPPGHRLQVADARVTVSCHAELPSFEPPEAIADADSSEGALRRTLEEQVAAGLDHAQPVCLASGGLDSSLLLALAARSHGDALLAATMGLEEDPDVARSFDIVARLGAKHLVLPVAEEKLAGGFEEAVLAQETLVIGALGVAKHLFFALLEERVSRVISGAGADELFSGAGRRTDPAERDAAIALLTPDGRALVHAPAPDSASGAAAQRDRVARDLPDLVLPPEVRSAERFRIAVALPYLARPVIELASRLPWARRRDGAISKVALRALAADLVPGIDAGAVKRPAAPAPFGRGEAARAAWREVLGGLLHRAEVARVGILDPDAVVRLLDETFALTPSDPRVPRAERLLLKSASLVVLARALARGAAAAGGTGDAKGG